MAVSTNRIAPRRIAGRIPSFPTANCTSATRTPCSATRSARTAKLMDMDHLSTKPIPSRDRLIFALDVPTVAEGKEWVEKLGDSVVFYKLGLQLFMAGGYYEFIDWLAGRGKKIFADLKFFDVPETVKSAVAQLTNRPITFVTV